MNSGSLGENRGLNLKVLSGLGYRLGKSGMDEEWYAKLSPCFQCFCLVMDGLLNRPIGYKSRGPRSHGSPGPGPLFTAERRSTFSVREANQMTKGHQRDTKLLQKDAERPQRDVK